MTSISKIALNNTVYDIEDKEAQSDLLNKQDTLVSGTNIKTINNQSLLGSGNIEIEASASIDDVTISENTDGELQAIGVINQNDTTTAIKTWTGTRAQYDAILVKDSNTLYNITDDTDVSLTLLNLLYPVGSVYITTNETCPLAVLISGSTWIKEATGVITGLSETAPCKGNGKTLGLTNGTDNVGLSVNANSAGNNHNLFQPSAFNIDVKTSGYGDSGPLGSYGVTTDSTKSGIITDLSSVATSYSVNLFRRTL